jgi:hypothetical protein
MVREFIEGWDLMQILGEGTFAEVKLLVNRDTGEACAMKEVDVKNRPDLQVYLKTRLYKYKSRPGVNFIKVLSAAFTLADPESVKKYS